ncbi:MAG: TonB-dependent receptor, partial [Steroidobacteraceae bacterium]
LGGRYTDEEQKFVDLEFFGFPAPGPDKRGFEKWTWRAALDYAFTPDIHSYVSFNRGVKGGGFDLLDPTSPGFDPEVLDAYEVGLKTQLLDHRLRLNASYFYYDYKNIQVQVVGANGAGIISTTNAAAATIKGLDVDFQFLPIEYLTLSGGFAWIKGEYDKFPATVSYFASPLDGPPQSIDASGNDTIRTPEFTGNLTAEYRIQSSMGEFPLSVTVSNNDGYFFGADNRMKQDGYTLLNAAIGWTAADERYGVTLWGRNLTDEYYLNQGVPTGTGDLVEPAAPRTYGVTFRAKF